MIFLPKVVGGFGTYTQLRLREALHVPDSTRACQKANVPSRNVEIRIRKALQPDTARLRVVQPDAGKAMPVICG
jgi:hypothetical protein